jgi:polyisoprenoid-binding protein YceI
MPLIQHPGEARCGYLYIHFIEGSAAAPLTVSAGATASSAAGTEDGNWTVGSGSQAGYRVGETLAGQGNTAVGRTTAITGAMTIAKSVVTTATFSVDLTKVASDQSRRDAQFQGRIMDTAKYPTATFRLTKPIDLGATVDSTGPVPVSTTGDLTLHGTTRNVTVPLTAQRNNAGIQLSGQIPVTFAEYGIPNPSIGSFVTTDDHGQAEILLNFTRPDPTPQPPGCRRSAFPPAQARQARAMDAGGESIPMWSDRDRVPRPPRHRRRTSRPIRTRQQPRPRTTRVGSPARATEAPTASSRRVGTGKEAPHGDQLPAAGPGPAVGQHIARDTERGPAARTPSGTDRAGNRLCC